MSGEWIKHDGKGCPLKAGTRVRARMLYASAEYMAGYEQNGVVMSQGGKSWDWEESEREGWDIVIEYIVLKPKGMEVLASILHKVETEPVNIEEFA